MHSLTETDKKKLEYLMPVYGDRIFDFVENGLNSGKFKFLTLVRGYGGPKLTIDIFLFCSKCGELQVIKNIDYYGYLAWIGGAMIQNALPSLLPDDRELLISGFCNKCWDETFKDDE